MGERNLVVGFSAAPAGLEFLERLTHSFTVGYFLPRLRRWAGRVESHANVMKRFEQVSSTTGSQRN